LEAVFKLQTVTPNINSCDADDDDDDNDDDNDDGGGGDS